jgi:hypothetical protein
MYVDGDHIIIWMALPHCTADARHLYCPPALAVYCLYCREVGEPRFQGASIVCPPTQTTGTALPASYCPVEQVVERPELQGASTRVAV